MAVYSYLHCNWLSPNLTDWHSIDLVAATAAATTLDSARGRKVSRISYIVKESSCVSCVWRITFGLSESQSNVTASNCKKISALALNKI